MRRHWRQIDAVEQHLPGIGPLEARNQTEQRGLAAARRPEQRKKLAFENIERQPVDNDSGAEALGQAIDAQQRTQSRIGPRRKISFRAGDLRLLRARAGN
jgi:hypothetical protein